MKNNYHNYIFFLIALFVPVMQAAKPKNTESENAIDPNPKITLHNEEIGVNNLELIVDESCNYSELLHYFPEIEDVFKKNMLPSLLQGLFNRRASKYLSFFLEEDGSNEEKRYIFLPVTKEEKQIGIVKFYHITYVGLKVVEKSTILPKKIRYIGIGGVNRMACGNNLLEKEVNAAYIDCNDLGTLDRAVNCNKRQEKFNVTDSGTKIELPLANKLEANNKKETPYILVKYIDNKYKITELYTGLYTEENKKPNIATDIPIDKVEPLGILKRKILVLL